MNRTILSRLSLQKKRAWNLPPPWILGIILAVLFGGNAYLGLRSRNDGIRIDPGSGQPMGVIRIIS